MSANHVNAEYFLEELRGCLARMELRPTPGGDGPATMADILRLHLEALARGISNHRHLPEDATPPIDALRGFLQGMGKVILGPDEAERIERLREIGDQIDPPVFKSGGAIKITPEVAETMTENQRLADDARKAYEAWIGRDRGPNQFPWCLCPAPYPPTWASNNDGTVICSKCGMRIHNSRYEGDDKPEPPQPVGYVRSNGAGEIVFVQAGHPVNLRLGEPDCPWRPVYTSLPRQQHPAESVESSEDGRGAPSQPTPLQDTVMVPRSALRAVVEYLERYGWSAALDVADIVQLEAALQTV